MLLSVIVPTYNEAATIDRLVRTVAAVRFPVDVEVVIVDDASADRTYEIARALAVSDPRIRVFRNAVNRGKGFAIREGLKRAKGELLIIQDADTEYDPADIPSLLDPVLKEGARVVYGSRFLGKGRPEGMALANYAANKFLTGLTNALYGLRITDMETCYKLFRADVLRGMTLTADRFAFEPEVTALVSKRKIPIIERPISYRGRTRHEGKKIKARDFFDAVGMLVRRLL